MNEQDKQACKDAKLQNLVDLKPLTFDTGWQAALEYARGKQEPVAKLITRTVFDMIAEGYDSDLVQKKVARILSEAQPVQPAACQYCDGTGDVHGIEGEWRGECSECKQPVQEPFGRVTVLRRPGCADQHFFYPWPHPPYLDNAAECHTVYTHPAPEVAINEQMLEALKNLRNEVVEYYGEKEFTLPHADAAIRAAEAAKGGV